MLSIVCEWAHNLQQVKLPDPFQGLLGIVVAVKSEIETIHSNCDHPNCSCKCHKVCP